RRSRRSGRSAGTAGSPRWWRWCCRSSIRGGSTSVGATRSIWRSSCRPRCTWSRTSPDCSEASPCGERRTEVDAARGRSGPAPPRVPAVDVTAVERDPLELQIRERPVPAHVGIIMDGNGRWAEERGLPRLEGHREGSKSVRDVTRTARRIGVQALTLYAFSAQNWSRPVDAVAGLMALLREYLEPERQEILENGIRLEAIGELDRLPRFVRAPLEAVREASARNRGMVLTLALSYGGQEEIVAAADVLVQRARAGT